MSTFDLVGAGDSSDSEDDVDYVPSAEESEDSVSGDDHEHASDAESGSQNRKAKRKQEGFIAARKRKGGIRIEGKDGLLAEEVCDVKDPAAEGDAEVKQVSKEDEKKKADLLWSDFLKDVDPIPKRKTMPPTPSSRVPEGTSAVLAPQSLQERNVKVKITEVFEFAGESVVVDKEVAADSNEAKEFARKQEQRTAEEESVPRASTKRVGGAGSVLGQLMNKKQKISTLEKSKLDWNTYKQAEGIEGELSTHNRGKDGYLEKQAFLQRADLRQFEIEKNMRAKNRLNHLI
ncbi:craniofacial development protein 1-like [Ornithodoros turicata]|uniref:craniofacial development protein 1-like n=1 Tax=Ornithodoros turicata TaxID=34597 RepID=UPI00313A0E72